MMLVLSAWPWCPEGLMPAFMLFVLETVDG